MNRDRLVPEIRDEGESSLLLFPVLSVMMILVPFLIALGSDQVLTRSTVDASTGRPTGSPAEGSAQSLAVEIRPDRIDVIVLGRMSRPERKSYVLRDDQVDRAADGFFIRLQESGFKPRQAIISPQRDVVFRRIVPVLDLVRRYFPQAALGRGFGR